jgi:Protein of unknown function (DUF2283)
MIRLKWDKEADALYIALTTAEWDHTDEIEDGTYVYVGAHNDPRRHRSPPPGATVAAGASSRPLQHKQADGPGTARVLPAASPSPPDSPPARQGPGHPPGCLTHVLCT